MGHLDPGHDHLSKGKIFHYFHLRQTWGFHWKKSRLTLRWPAKRIPRSKWRSQSIDCDNFYWKRRKKAVDKLKWDRHSVIKRTNINGQIHTNNYFLSIYFLRSEAVQFSTLTSFVAGRSSPTKFVVYLYHVSASQVHIKAILFIIPSIVLTLATCFAHTQLVQIYLIIVNHPEVHKCVFIKQTSSR